MHCLHPPPLHRSSTAVTKALHLVSQPLPGIVGKHFQSKTRLHIVFISLIQKKGSFKTQTYSIPTVLLHLWSRKFSGVLPSTRNFLPTYVWEPFISTSFWSWSSLWCLNERWQRTHGENRADEMQSSIIYAESVCKVHFKLPWFSVITEVGEEGASQKLQFIFWSLLYFSFSLGSLKQFFSFFFSSFQSDLKIWAVTEDLQEM